MGNLVCDDDKKNYKSICYIEDWTDEKDGEYYFIREINQGHVTRKIGPYSSIIFGFKIIPFNKDTYKITMERSNSRMISELKAKENTTVDSYQIKIQLKVISEKN